MEIQYIVRFSFSSSDDRAMAQQIFSVDGPVFEDEVPSQYRKMFRELENVFPPEEVIQCGDLTLEANWTAGSNFEELLEECLNGLTKAGAQRVVVYYWADEEDGFLIAKSQKKYTRVKAWRKQLKALGLKYSSENEEWISMFLAHLQNTSY